MNTRHHVGGLLAALATALMFLTPREAAAVELDTVVSPIHQIGVTANVSLGHTAIGYTNYNRLTVSGTYSAACASSVMLPTVGQRSLTREEIVGGFSLITTIPAQLPSTVSMPGFTSLPAGSRVACTYNWTSKAVESSYSLGIPGFGSQTGGAERADGGTYPFTMVVRAADTWPRDGCV
jgi:hypothetical protein